MSKKQKILLFGPYIGDLKNAYGGGTGGYTRNMFVYINHYLDSDFQQIPFFHSVRGQLKLDFFFVRFIYDIVRFIISLLIVKPEGIHILAQYRTAIPREFFVILVSRIFGIPVLYEQKAGAFIPWFKSTNFLFKYMAEYCLNKSTIVLTEGIPHKDFLKRELNIDAMYFPNFVPDNEVPEFSNTLFNDDVLRILFVGYCYKNKGIFELVNGCNISAQKEKIILTIIGYEHENFTKWINDLTIHPNLQIHRLGKQPHENVLEQFKKNDIYCYPTSHKGEGHNNTINEAMMMGVVIVTTKNGFLGSVLSEDRAYFLKSISEESIARAISLISSNKELANCKAKLGKEYLQKNFLASIAFDKLSSHYKDLLKD